MNPKTEAAVQRFDTAPDRPSSIFLSLRSLRTAAAPPSIATSNLASSPPVKVGDSTRIRVSELRRLIGAV